MISAAFLARAMALAGNGGLDGIARPVLRLIERLALYPSARNLDTPEGLEALLRDDEQITQGLIRAVEALVDVPIWDTLGDGAGADLAENCLEGLAAWSRDRAQLAAHHPLYTAEMAHTAALHAQRAIEADLPSPPPKVSGAGEGSTPSPAAPRPAAAGRRCACGEPAREELFGFPICSACLNGAAELLDAEGRR